MNGFNCADITNLLSYVEELSVRRAFNDNSQKYICDEDFKNALKMIHSSVQMDDIVKLNEWRKLNDFNRNQEEVKASEEELSPIKNEPTPFEEIDVSSEDTSLKAPKIDFEEQKDEDKTELSEVVVTALGIKRDRKALGYGVAEIKGADLTKAKETK